MHDAARAAALAIGYVGAGTVEFLYDPATERFFFLEMNTRLQVEHPVTEEVFGVDLVALQLAVAEGASCAQDRSLHRSRARAAGPVGHAIEVRLYAEDPARDFQPQSGVLTTFDIPVEHGIRVDAGFESGSEVSTHYDAMLAKVVCHAATRQQAARQLAGVLSRARIHGVTHQPRPAGRDPPRPRLPGRQGRHRLPRPHLGRRRERTGDPAPAAAGRGHRRAGRAPARPPRRPARHPGRLAQRHLAAAGHALRAGPRGRRGPVGRDGYLVEGLEVGAVTRDTVTLVQDGIAATYDLRVDGDAVEVDGPLGHARLVERPRFTDPADAVASGSLLAPMPGSVVRVAVEQGQQVEAGQPVLVLEAMKMQHTVVAPTAGTVTRIEIQPGAQVAALEVLAVVEAVEEA